jgi:hypothetical protein
MLSPDLMPTQIEATVDSSMGSDESLGTEDKLSSARIRKFGRGNSSPIFS